MIEADEVTDSFGHDIRFMNVRVLAIEAVDSSVAMSFSAVNCSNRAVTVAHFDV